MLDNWNSVFVNLILIFFNNRVYIYLFVCTSKRLFKLNSFSWLINVKSCIAIWILISFRNKFRINEAMSLTTENITETSDDDALVRKFNCVKCSIPLQDIKLLKKHFWKVHIAKNEIFQHLSDKANQHKAVKRQSLPENTSFKGLSNPRKRKLTADSHEPRNAKKKSTKLSDVSLPVNSSKYESSDESSFAEESTEPSEYDKTMEKLNSIEPKDIATFSLADDIDEDKLIQKYRLKYGSSLCNKCKFLLIANAFFFIISLSSIESLFIRQLRSLKMSRLCGPLGGTRARQLCGPPKSPTWSRTKAATS